MNEDFRYMAAIAEHGSISKAARAVHISQPGLSQRLRRLEGQMGTELFDRNSSPLRPTASGEVYLKYAMRALAAEESMRREVHNASTSRRRTLRVGASMSRANALLAEPIVSFYASHRGCTLELFEIRSFDDMHRLFLDDGIDFAVLTPIVPDPGEYAMEVLCHERLQVVVSERFSVPQLASKVDRVSLRQLEGIPFVLPTCGSYFDPLISRIIDVANVQLDIVVRDCDAELALSLVQEGLGASVVPSTWLTGRQGLRAFDVDGIGAGNVLRYIRRRDRALPPEETVFMDILRDSLA